MSQSKPTIALFTGDPAGIGPELIEKLLSRSDTQEKANIILIGQKNAFDFPSYVKVHNWSGFNAPGLSGLHSPACVGVVGYTPGEFNRLGQGLFFGYHGAKLQLTLRGLR